MACELLTVWNPYFEPHTIQVHVEILRRQWGAPSRRVWWGRLFNGSEAIDEATARRKWKRVARLADEAAAAGRELVLYATNFQVLHALRVARVIFGPELPPGEEAFVPAYYRRHAAKPAIWFEVRDIRALSFDSIETMRFFLQSPNAEGFAYDPWASFWHWYPVEFAGPGVGEIFDRSRLGSGAELFADLPETIYPPEVQHARRELAQLLGPPWERLEEKSRVFLATSWLVYGKHHRTPGFDLSAALSGVARAVETEICEGIFDPLHALASARLGAEEATWRVFGEARGAATLGVVARRLPELTTLASELGLHALERLARDRAFRRWFDRFVSLRNRASHVGELKPATVRALFDSVVAPADDSQLAMLLPPKEELADRVRA